MEECEHYTIRGDVAKLREMDPWVSYPFSLADQGRRLEQVKSLLPNMDSRKCKQWDCQHCISELMEKDCIQDHLAIETGPFVAIHNLEPAMDIINVDTPGVARVTAFEVHLCTDLQNAGVKKKPLSEPRVFFDLNEAPNHETCDEILEINISPAATSECAIAELVSVDKQQAGNLKDAEPETFSFQVPDSDIGNANVSPSPEIIEEYDSGDDVAPGRSKTSVNKIARKYRKVSYLTGERKKEGCQNAPSSGRQPKKNESKNNKKMLQILEPQVASKISDATQDAIGENMKNRTFDFHLPLDQNYQLASVSLSPQRASSGKRKNQPSHDQNGDSEAVERYSSKGLQKESRRIPQLKKRRIFGDGAKTRLTDVDQSQQVVLDGAKSKTIPESLGSHQNDKNKPSSSKRKETPSPVGDSANSLPIRNKATSKAAVYQLMLGSKLKTRDCNELSRSGLDKKCTDKILVLQDKRPILPPSDDIPMPCVEDDRLKLSELVPEISKKKLLNCGVSLKRLVLDSPSANKKQKSSGKAAKKQESKRKVVVSRASDSDSKNKGEDGTNASPVLPSEDALHLLSLVASQYMQFDAISDSELDRTTDPVTEESHTPPTVNVLALGYGGCIEVTNPADYFLVESERDCFKLGPENLPLRPHRMFPLQRAALLLRQEDFYCQRANAATCRQYLL